MVGDADGRQCHRLIMFVDPGAIVVMGAGKTDHFPRSHIVVAAIDRIGKKTGLRILQNEFEEILAVGAIELKRTIFETCDRLVFCSSERSPKVLPPYLSWQALLSAANPLR